jgi:hypothetical protein
MLLRRRAANGRLRSSRCAGVATGRPHAAKLPRTCGRRGRLDLRALRTESGTDVEGHRGLDVLDREVEKRVRAYRATAKKG